MTLQRKVYQEQALGVVGEFADTSPKRVAAYVLGQMVMSLLKSVVFTHQPQKIMS